MATINGTSGPDTLPGTSTPDDIYGLGGNDIINGFSGEDVLFGGDGADYLNHNTSTDYLLDDFFYDYLDGGAGNDVIDIGAFDIAHGGDGIDRVTFYATQSYFGGGGVNWDLTGVTDVNSWLNNTFAGWVTVTGFEQLGLVGTSGNDVMIGNDLDAGLPMTMEGYGGNDQLEGRGGRDELWGGDGDDILRGDDGDDLLDGGAGADDIQGGNGFDTFMTRITGGDPLAVTVDLTIATAQDTGNGNDTIVGVENLRGIAESANQTFHFLGDAGFNTLTGSLGADTLDGRDGSDFLRGGAGGDSLIGGNGLDELSYFGSDAGVSINLTALTASGGHATGDSFSGIENVNATEFDDSLTGDGFANRFVGNGGVDTLNGLAGADTLIGGLGADVINGGDDADQIWNHLQGETSADNAVDVIDGGGGNDNIVVGEGDVAEGGLGTDQAFAGFYGRGAGITLDLSTGAEAALEAMGGFQLSGFEFFHVTGTAHADHITGSAVGEQINGGEGDDTLIGGGGFDTLLGGLGNDSLDGGVANDAMIGGFGNDIYYLDDVGDSANEAINQGTDEVRTALASHTLALNVENLVFTSAGNHTGVGNASSNVLTGHDGDDILTGLGGDDFINGGAGSDTAVFTGNRALWTIQYLGDGVHLSNGSETNLLTGIEFLAFADMTIAAATPNVINGTEDDETLQGDAVTPGVDIIHGLGGADTIVGHGESDALYGDGGTDQIFGGDGDDHIEGGADNDQIEGELGADTLLGQDGADQLSGGDGDDHIEGGADSDDIDGGLGADTLLGEDGDDTILGGDGADTLLGQDGDDTIRGGDGVDHIEGGNGGDNLFGDGGDDTLLAGPGAVNYLDGGDGADHLQGGASVNFYLGGAGADYIDGSAGFYDLARYTTAVVVDLVGDTETGEAVGDVLVGIESIALSEFNDEFIGDDTGREVSGAGGDDIVRGGLVSDNVQGGDGNDHVLGGGGADMLQGQGGDDLLEGGEGADNFLDGEGHNVLDGGNGNDQLLVQMGSDVLTLDLRLTTAQATGTGSSLAMTSVENVSMQVNRAAHLTGSDVANFLSGGGQDDVLIGMAGNDILNGGNGADSLSGGADVDTLSGDSGDDILRGGGGADGLHGGDDIDTADYSLAASGVTASLLTDSASNDGDGGTDVFSGVENLTGSAFADNLTGDTFANTLSGGAGADSLDGGDGDDVLRGGAGVDVMTGGAGLDTVDYSLAAAGMRAQLNTNASTNDGNGGTDTFSGMENLTGSAFNDILIGDGAVNVLRGGLGVDSLVGLGGNDILWGGSGSANALQGGLGDDWYVLEANDTVTEFGGEGADTIEAKINAYVLAANVETLIFTGVGNFAATGNNAASTITGGGGDDNLRGRGGIDVLNGGLGSDTVDYTLAAAGVTARLDQMKATNDGDGATDTFSGIENLIGSNFNDLLIGDGGNNVLMGGIGVDTLLGFGGNDVLHGGPTGGNNQLQGGTGDDWYVLDAFDTCVEFVGEGTDTVEARIGNYVMRVNIENLIYTGSTKFVGTGNALDNHMTGGAQNDILRGMGGNDTILGGLGIDELQVRGAKAEYTVAAEGSGWRIIDTVGGRDGSIYVESIEVVRFTTGNTSTALTYPPPAPAPLETSGKDTGPEVLPGLVDDKTWDDAFVLPAVPDDQPIVLPGLESDKFFDAPQVLPGTFEAAPDYFGLAAHLPPTGDWMIALDPEGGLFRPPAGYDWMG